LELSFELTVDEDVAGVSGDDDGGGLVVVGGADGDGVGLVDVADTIVDGDVVGVGGGSERPVGWPGFRGLFPDGGGGFAADGPVGTLVVVVVAEDIELGLEFFEAGGSRLGSEPLLHGVMESFHFALGLGMVGSSMVMVDAEGFDRVGEADLVDVGVVG